MPKPYVRIYMEEDMKTWLEDFAARRNVTISQLVCDELEGLMRFDHYQAITHAAATRDDLTALAETIREGETHG